MGQRLMHGATVDGTDEDVTVALCVVPPDLFDEVRANYPSFDWASPSRYRAAVEKRLTELYEANRRVEVALFDPEEYVDWCQREERNENSSATRAAWAAQSPYRLTYYGDLEDLLMYDVLLERSVEGTEVAEAALVEQIGPRLNALLRDIGSVNSPQRGLLDVLVYDTTDEDRTPYTRSFGVEWRADDSGSTVVAVRASEYDLIIALLGMGLVNGGAIDLTVASVEPEPSEFPSIRRWRWMLGAEYGGLFTGGAVTD